LKLTPIISVLQHRLMLFFFFTLNNPILRIFSNTKLGLNKIFQI